MESIQDELVQKMVSHCNYTEEIAQEEAAKICGLIKGHPLEKNLTEWLEIQPISDVSVGKWCVRNVLEIRGHVKGLSAPYNREILQVIYALLVYENNTEVGEILIRNIKR